MKKFLIGFLIALFLAGGIFFFIFKTKHTPVVKELKATKEELELLKAEKLRIGETVETWVLARSVKRGSRPVEADFELKVMPAAVVPENRIQSPEELYKEHIFKTDFAQNTTATSDLFTKVDKFDDKYRRDFALAALPSDLIVGDRFNIVVTLPGGLTFVAVENKEVLAINDKVINFNVSEEEGFILDAVEHDSAVFNLSGIQCTLQKYVEPGITAGKVAPFYPVTADAEVIINLSPNIWDTTRCINSDLRKYIDDYLGSWLTEEMQTQSSLTSAGRDDRLSKLAAAYQLALEKRLELMENQKAQENQEVVDPALENFEYGIDASVAEDPAANPVPEGGVQP